MRRRMVRVVGLTSVVMLGCLHAPVLWSPDGRWLAYTMAVRPGPPSLTPGWIFETGREAERPLSWGDQAPRPAAAIYRLWATRADTGASVVLEESRGPLTSPCWSPDGKVLAFGRLVPEDDGRARFEVVVQEALDR
ncbi:MAG: PD40 domain-containing protein, partial [Planctomycetaceae bacterium]|nr:PD40 domain-containing protein [Planctomycetaceae bacterium]